MCLHLKKESTPPLLLTILQWFTFPQVTSWICGKHGGLQRRHRTSVPKSLIWDWLDPGWISPCAFSYHEECKDIRSSPTIKILNPLCCHDHINITLIWLFPYPYGFCNLVRIHRMKMNDMIWHDIWYESASQVTCLKSYLTVVKIERYLSQNRM